MHRNRPKGGGVQCPFLGNYPIAFIPSFLWCLPTISSFSNLFFHLFTYLIRYFLSYPSLSKLTSTLFFFETIFPNNFWKTSASLNIPNLHLIPQRGSVKISLALLNNKIQSWSFVAVITQFRPVLQKLLRALEC